MNWTIIRTIALKDLQEVRQNRMAWIPALFLPLIFVVVMPLALILIPQVAQMSPEDIAQEMGDLEAMLANLPPAIQAEIADLQGIQVWIVLFIGYSFAPMFLILPLFFASTIGAESFAGEKERKTLEALLYTPASDRELFIGKVLASVMPAFALTLLSFLAYIVVVNTAGFSVMGRIWFPLPHWYPLILWVAPAVATLGMAAAVLVSSRASTFMEAYQTSGALVIPLIILLVGQLAGVIYLSIEFALVLGLIIWLIDAALIYVGIRQFKRAELIARL
jgi:ABC-type transport system involved in multi-copper enzyme maturation permease subunit